MIRMVKETWLPKIKLWDGTPSHASTDTLLMKEVSLSLRELGFKTEHKAMWSFEDLHNGKIAYVTHTRRVGGQRPYGISQADAEKYVIDMYTGKMPINLAMQVAAHGHTVRGTIDDEPFRIVNSPCFATFMEYPKAQASFPHWQTDIGAYFIVITKEGRIRLQSWIYPPFIYNHNEAKVYSGEYSNAKYVAMTTKTPVLESYFKALCEDAKFIIAVTADYHVGHVGALAPAQYELNGQTWNVSQTPANKRMFSYWQNFVAVCKIIKPNELWVVGDACNGVQRSYDQVSRALTQNLDEQKAMFVELFKEFL
jgi:hypothetical protein